MSKQNSNQGSQPTTSPVINKRVSVFRVSVTLAILTLVITTGVLATLVIQQQQQVENISQKLALLNNNSQQAIQLLQQDIDNSKDSLVSNDQQLVNQVNELQLQLEKINQLDKHQYHQTIAQIGDFITMGQLYASNLYEPKIAVRWLELAKNKIEWLADPRLQNLLLPIEEVIKEIENKQLDNSLYEFYQQVHNLQHQVEALIFIAQHPSNEQLAENGILNKLTAKLQGLIKVKQYNSDILYSGNYAANAAKQRLKLLLDQVFFAGIHGQQLLYKATISELNQIITHYFDISQASGASFLNSINQLNSNKKSIEYSGFAKLQNIVNQYKHLEE